VIRVIVERKLKKKDDIGRLLFKLHMIAVSKRGHVSNETWIDAKNDHNVTVFSTWQRLEDWQSWEASKERFAILGEIEPLLAEEARIKVYEIMSAEDCEYYEDPENWMQVHEHSHFSG
jgi:hypothetical protein